MKKIFIFFTVAFISTNFSQTVNFDTVANWTAGIGGTLASYQSDHQYNTSINGVGIIFTGGPALRQNDGTQDGALSTYNNSSYAWRLRDNSSVSWIATVNTNSINGFSFRVRRWDGAPSPDFDVAYSSDVGSVWNSVGTVNNTFLNNTSDWSLFSYNFTITATPDIKVRLQANGSTERIMIDDFTINTVNGELLFYEDFNFSGDLRDNGWVSYLGTQNQITTTTGLAYSGYEGSGIGNAAYLYGAGGEDIYRLLTPQNSDGSTLYLSFLVNVTDTDLNDGGSYSLHMADAPNFDILTDQFCCAFHMRIVDGSVNFGVRVSTLGGNEEWDPTDYSKNQTYLIIIKYVINFSANDEISLWVKSAGVPSSESNAGTPGAYSNVGAGLDELDAICFRQVPGGDILEATYDGFRISDSWDFAPLPVELSSFSAVVLENGVKLEWRTETEVNNYGFEILRSTQNDNGQKIGFVEGHGNSNSPKEYSFTDNNAQYGSFAYRLKQIDTDGDYEYSNIIEVDAGNIPNGFVLEQNFPNPFNPTTSIKFALGKTQNVELKVFDVLGNEVATLFNGLADGEKVYETEFNAENFSSGIYFYRLETKNKVENRKMMLLK